MIALLVLTIFSGIFNLCNAADNINKVCYDGLPANVSQNCCKSTTLNNLKYFDNQCGQYKLSVMMGNNQISGLVDLVNACYVQCIWNTTGVMESENVMNATKLTPIFKLLLGEYAADKDVVDILENTIKECAANVYNNIAYGKTLTSLYESDFSPVEGVHCSWVPLLIMTCAEDTLFRNCPERYWQKGDKDCTALLKFSKCIKDIKLDQYKKFPVEPSGIAVIH